MRFIRGIIGLIALVLIVSNVAAPVSDFPRYVTLSDEEKEISFNVSNSSAFKKNLKIELYVPTNFEIIELPEFIEPNQSKQVRILFYPNEDLYGTNYESTLLILLGSEKMEEKINFSFVKLVAEEEGEGEVEQDGEGAVAGFVGLFSLPNLEGITALINWELALDVFLILLAAVLLIAFIARLVTRLTAGQTKLQAEPERKNKSERLEELKNKVAKEPKKKGKAK